MNTTTKNIYDHKTETTFEGYSSFGAAYMVHVARRATISKLRIAYHKSGMPFVWQLLQDTIHGEGIGEDLLQEAFVAVWQVAEGLSFPTFTAIKEDGRKAVARVIDRYIYGERKRANMADIAELEGAVEDISLRLEGYTMTEDIIRTIVNGLPKKANKGLYCRIIARVMEGETEREIATAEGISPSRVHAVIVRGRELLIEGGYTPANIAQKH